MPEQDFWKTDPGRVLCVVIASIVGGGLLAGGITLLGKALEG